MSIYIKGMKMPADGNETIIRIQPDGTVLDQYGHYLAITAISIPPHGRLGDLDELYAFLKKWLIQNRHSMTEATRVWIRGVLEGIATAPTIIQAENGK